MLRMLRTAGTLALGLLAAGCTVGDETEDERRAGGGAAGDTVATAARPAAPRHDLRLEVDLASRELNVFRGPRRVATHPVAVGSEEWPTPTGEWTIDQVVWNPRWHPPDEDWAADEEIAEPGDPDNPLGRAQLVYRAPNSIHGTSDKASLGKAVSHGSIRVSNEVAVELARMVMETGGAPRDAAWYERVQADSTQRVEVAIPDPVPIRVVDGPVGAAGDSTPAPADSAAARRSGG